jgi:glutamate/tyrosine decarboxylase-like PLP-dependent enzyme
MDVAALREAVAADLAAIARFCCEQDLWMHVDGAFGATTWRQLKAKRNAVGTFPPPRRQV